MSSSKMSSSGAHAVPVPPPQTDRDPSLGRQSALVPPNSACVTHEGYHRQANEDRGSVFDSPLGRVVIVCDGMGGHEGGEKAAEITMDVFRRVLTGADAGADSAETLRACLSTANNEILAWRKTRPALRNMGSTVVVAVIHGGQLVVGHVGDSRAYLVRNGNIQRLTRDQTLVQDFIERGHITEDQARSHPFGNALKQAVGQDQEPVLEIGKPTSLARGDVVFACSDGLSGYVKDSAMQKVLSTGLREPLQMVEAFIALALATGGQDNVTAALTIVTDGPEPKPEETQKLIAAISAAVVDSGRHKVAAEPARPDSPFPGPRNIPDPLYGIAWAVAGALVSYLALVLTGALPRPF